VCASIGAACEQVIEQPSSLGAARRIERSTTAGQLDRRILARRSSLGIDWDG
jgi:hypothetical protein